MTLRDLIRKEMNVRIEIRPEHIPIADSFDDPSTVKEIEEQLQYNLWAWCVVCICVTWAGLSATAYLGCCSYTDQAEFVAQSGYYDDMVGECADEIAADVKLIVEASRQCCDVTNIEKGQNSNG